MLICFSAYKHSWLPLKAEGTEAGLHWGMGWALHLELPGASEKVAVGSTEHSGLGQEEHHSLSDGGARAWGGGASTGPKERPRLGQGWDLHTPKGRSTWFR